MAKTKTSTEVKRRYNEKVYTVIRYSEKKEVAIAFKEKCEAKGISQAEVLRRAVMEFIENE